MSAKSTMDMELHSAEVSPNRCVPHLVTAQAAAAPNAIAVTHGKLSLTYKELDRRAAQLAHVLHSLGVGPDIIVGLYLNRSLAMVVGALAILKAGGAYLPLDPTYPKERLGFFLNDAEVRILVTGHCMVDGLPVQPEHVVTLDPEGRLLAPCSFEPIAAEVKPENLAYVIYTSGSTGQPKGVELTHGGLSNLVLWHRRAFSVNSNDLASQLAALSFDAAVWEVWPYLTSGASIHLADGLAVNDPEAVRDWLVSRGITICFLPTPLAERVMTLKWPTRSALRVMLTGADTLHHYPPRNLPFQLVNNYGPTECTVVATSGTVFPEEHSDRLPTIGRPIDNTQIYILNEKMQQVPSGGQGEIYIGGTGLARGYRNRSHLSFARFIPNPFSTEPGTRLYKTGDLGRYLPDGQIAFEGRVDDQLKIRGYRIEPNEVVNVLAKHPSLQGSAVVAREDSSGDKQLVAYVVPSFGAELTSGSLREYLHDFLPEYAIPSLFVQVERLPLTPNGKIDREALPPPESANILRDAPVPAVATALGEQVATILSQLLDIDVGVNDNFFLLGGHSLLGTRVIARVRENFGVELPLRTIFEAPTAAELAVEIERVLLAKVEEMSDEEAQRALEIISATENRGN